MIRFLIVTLSLGLQTFVLHASSGEPEIVDNFALIDHQGRFHELDYACRIPGTKGIVLFIHGNGCPLVQKRAPELKRLRDAYQKHGILFAMLNANLQDEREEVAAEAAEWQYDLPILMDESQMVASMLDIKRTGEAILIAADDKRIVYRGAIDDKMTYQKEKPEATAHYLKDALEAFLSGSTPEPNQTDAPGCKITLATSESTISYSDEVAPILKKRCVGCHTKGGIGPFAMSKYSKVKGWSDMIEEVVLTKQMPPWHADPHIGTFLENAGLTSDEKRTLLTWIRQGSPRGDGSDPLEAYAPEKKDWKLGEPDHVMALPEQKIPAEGVLDYRYVRLESPFDHDVWLSGIEVNPGNTQVLHHVVITGRPKEKRGQRNLGKWFTGYAPGTAAWPTPEGTGILLPKGYLLRFQLHYTTNGKAELDQTKIGFHILEKPPKKEVRTEVVINPEFRIPPRKMEHSSEWQGRPFPDDVIIYAMNPHMHYRGKRMSFHAKLPDGTTKDLLSVPNYNFNWQRTYVLKEPLRLPKGTRLLIKNAWDNSALNPHNPDPNKSVRWGEQSFEEMFFATVQYTLDN